MTPRVKSGRGCCRLGAYILGAVLVAACNGTADPTQSKLAAFAPSTLAISENVSALTCGDHGEVGSDVGRLTNNVWNKQAIGGAPYEQCILVRESPNGKEYGWAWSWPVDSDSVVAYPETVIGWKPWVGGRSSDERLPIRIDAIQTMRLSYVIETVSNASHNLATSIWLTRSGTTGFFPRPDDISSELMIWTDDTGFSPAGEYVGKVTIDDLDFEIWWAKDWGDNSGAASNRWGYIAYRSQTKTRSATLDIKKILLDAVNRGMISAEHYVPSIEVGNEVINGTGETWIRSLSLDVR